MEPQQPESVLEELAQIDRMHRDIPEQLRRWLALWQQHLQGDKILTADLEVAMRLTVVGSQTALRQKRYQDALDLFTALSSHPHFDQIEPDWLALLSSMQMLCYLRIGEEIRAAEVGYQLLKMGTEEDEWSAKHALCTNLFTYLACNNSGKETEESTEEFTRLVMDTARIFDPDVPIDTLPERATHQQLYPLVLRTFQKVMSDRISAAGAGKAKRDFSKANDLKCQCGHRLTCIDLIQQKVYVPEYYGESQVVVTFRCIQCQRKGEFFIRQEDWEDSLLDDVPGAPNPD